MTCLNNFTAEADFNPSGSFTDYPPYLCPVSTLGGYETVGTDIMNAILLNQYSDSVNLKEFIGAYVIEIDTLFNEMHKVREGRFIANATGTQLDVIGVILQQSRSLNVPKVWFGFQGASPVAGMADESVPSVGGVFKSEDEVGYTVTPLTDSVYRNVLLCRGFVLNQESFDVNTIYKAIELLLGKTPNYIKLVEVGDRDWVLELSTSVTTTSEVGIILATAHWFIPMTISFNVNLI